MDTDELEESPGIYIPCESVEDLQQLVYLLFQNRILEDETAFQLRHVPENITEILNDPLYFEPINIFGILISRGELPLLERNTEDLL